MTTKDFKRKLSAIFSADVEGYSLLMREDEEATIRTLKAYRAAIRDLVQQYRGRVVDSPGDNILSEFASVVDAVNCAVEIQRELAERNTDLPENRRMQFRIGVNLGDIVEDGERIYGDGVNIAARMESLSEGGGICISGKVYEEVKHKLGLEYEYQGEQEVKNIPEPVQAYKVLSFPGAAAHRVVKAKKAVRRTRRNVAFAIAAVLVVGGAVAIWWFYMPLSPPPEEVDSKDKKVFPLPDKPSIAVLPFANLSDDPKQEYFSDGMTDDLITDLSKISGLLVIARNSSFTYKGKSLKVQHVGKDLGVKYVLEGSVRRAGNDVRINAQLIDATTGHHLWAERYDGKVKDIFTLQDKITSKIVSALAVKLTVGERKHVESMETDSIEAYDAFLKGYEHYLRQTVDGIAASIKYFEKAMELDKNYGRAYAMLAKAYFMGPRQGQKEWYYEIRLTYPFCMLRSRHYLQMAMKRPTDISHEVASLLALQRRKYDKAMSEAEKAMALNPSGYEANQAMGYVLLNVGRPKEAINYFKRTLELQPLHPGWPLFWRGVAHFNMGQFNGAVDLVKRALTHYPKNAHMSCILAAAYAHIGLEKEARDALEDYLKYWWPGKPDLRQIMIEWPFKQQKDADRLAQGLVKAGLPGHASEYYKISKKNKLTGKEIRKVLFGHTLKSATVGGGYPFSWDKEGRITYKSPGINDTGKSWIEGNTLFMQWETLYEGRKHDMEIYRNPGGTAECMIEYFFVTDFGIAPFSVVD